MVGQSPQRYDIPAKVDGSLKWAVDVKLPGMVHARNVKPPFAGAKLVSIDESSVRGMPGFIKVVSKGNYVAVVCEREEQAINASRQLKANWEKPATAPFPSSEDLFKYMRSATPTSTFQSDRGGRSGRGVRRRGQGHRSRIRRSVPGAHRIRPGACDGGSVERPDDDLFERHEVVRHAHGRRRSFSACRARKCASFGWKVRKDTAAPPPTMRDARRLTWRRRSAARFACSGCGTKKRRGIPRLRRSRSRCAEGWMPPGIWWRSTTMPGPPTTITSVITSPTRC